MSVPSSCQASLSESEASISAGHAYLWYQWTERCSDQCLAYYDSLLDDSERRRLDRLASDRLRREFLVTRGLCRESLSRYSTVEPPDWSFVSNPWGKPEIDRAVFESSLRFNLSNTDTVVTCLITSGIDAGVDVENVSRQVDFCELASQFFTPTENQGLHEAPVIEMKRRFFQLWTLKESFIKAEGKGLSIPLDDFEFHFTEDDIRIVFVAPYLSRACNWQFALFDLDDTHVAAVSILKGARPDFVIIPFEANWIRERDPSNFGDFTQSRRSVPKT